MVTSDCPPVQVCSGSVSPVPRPRRVWCFSPWQSHLITVQCRLAIGHPFLPCTCIRYSLVFNKYSQSSWISVFFIPASSCQHLTEELVTFCGFYVLYINSIRIIPIWLRWHLSGLCSKLPFATCKCGEWNCCMACHNCLNKVRNCHVRVNGRELFNQVMWPERDAFLSKLACFQTLCSLSKIICWCWV